MSKMNLLKILSCATALFACAGLQAQNKNADAVRIQVDPDAELFRISSGFMGFGYETSAVAQSNFFNTFLQAIVTR
jgi:hypothetical protein